MLNEVTRASVMVYSATISIAAVLSVIRYTHTNSYTAVHMYNLQLSIYGVKTYITTVINIYILILHMYTDITQTTGRVLL